MLVESEIYWCYHVNEYPQSTLAGFVMVVVQKYTASSFL